MKIYGLQKMTLLDYPGKVACTVFTGGCDFRCPFCHNYELACGKTEPVMEEEALLRFLEDRRGLLDGVAVTGGEPCLQQELPGLLRRIRRMGFLVKLDSNGYHPGMMRQLIDEGLVDYVAMDIKNSQARYAMTAGCPEKDFDFGRILESLSLLKEDRVDYELRTTVVRELHRPEDFEQIGVMIRGARRYFLQSFTDRDQVPFAGLHAPSDRELMEYAGIVRVYVPDTQLR